MTQKKYLNLGCGRVILPSPKPQHYHLIDEGITDYALWHNVDRNPEPGVDECLDIFRYPWPWADNSFDGALVAHVAEHIPHEIHEAIIPTINPTVTKQLHERLAVVGTLQDGWYAFWSELHRVLTPGALIHVLSPYAFSSGAMTDPSHTRYLTEHVWTHSMQPTPDAPFNYATGGLNLEVAAPIKYTPTGLFAAHNEAEFFYQLQRYINVAYEMYVKLRVVK